MEEQEIMFPTAKLAKEKNFNLVVTEYFIHYLISNFDDIYPGNGFAAGTIKNEGGFHFKNNDEWTDLSNENYVMYARPSQSLLQKWLRDIHNIQVYVYSHTVYQEKDCPPRYKDYVGYINGSPINDARDEEYPTYEDAMEIALIKALELIK